MILVTGGTGLIGSHLLLALCRRGLEVRATYRFQSSQKNVERLFKRNHVRQLYANIEWVEADILEVEQLYMAMQNVDWVFHCAGNVSFNPRKAIRVTQVNVIGSANVVNVAIELKINKLCFVSSTAALGKVIGSSLINEDAIWVADANNSTYANSKYMAEMEMWRGFEEGLNGVIVNPAIVIGPGVWGRSSTRVFSQIFKGMRFYSHGGNGYIDVRDVAEIMIRLMEGDFNEQRYVLVSENLSFEDLFKMIAKQFNKSDRLMKATPLMGEIAWRLLAVVSALTGKSPVISKDLVRAGNWTNKFDNSKITKALDYKFIPVETSIYDTCQVFLQEAVLQEL